MNSNLETSRPGNTGSQISGNAIIGSLKAAEIKFIAALPDIVTSDGLLWPISEDSDFRLIRICKEDEGVSICAAMSYNGTRALLLMQQTGLMDSLNAIRAIGMDYRLPVIMMVGLQGMEPNVAPEDSASYGVRIIRPVLDAMLIPNTMINNSKSIEKIVPTIRNAYLKSIPHVFLIGNSPSAI